MPNETILIVDDEENIRKTLAGVLADDGYEVALAATGQEALDLLSEVQPSLALLDIRMPGMDGIETLRCFKELRPEMPVIMITGHGDVEESVKTVKMGAYDFIKKPLDLETLLLAVKHGVEAYRLRRENETLRRRVERTHGAVGDGPATLKDARRAFEREFIVRKLLENRGNISRTADAIGVERSNLHRKIKALGIEAD